MTAAGDLLENVQAYLRRHGWVEEPPGPAGSWWHQPAQPTTEETVIGVPDRIVPGTIEWRSVIERLAAYEQRSFEAIAETIRDQFIDVTQLSAASDFVIAGSIPLSAGVSLLSSARVMLRAAATAAVRPRAHIAGNFSKLGDDVASRARLGHTREGSYVIPLLMPLTEPRDDLAHEPLAGMETERVAYEPAERRVTRTLAQALAAVQQGIVDPAREPRASDIAPLVAAGVNRELVVAVERILGDPAVSEFEASFQWADAVTPPGGVPRRVEMPAAAEPLLATTARLLKSSRKDPGEVVTGPIVEVRHLPDDPFGEIAVQTVRAGRMSEIRVQLPTQDLDRALEWMRQARAVLVEGQLIRIPGQPLRMSEPTRVHPLDEAFLL